MKLAHCIEPSHDEGKLTQVWVNDSAEIGDVLSPIGRGCSLEIIAFSELNKIDTELVKAEDLQVGDEIYYQSEWRTVLHTYVHPKSCYQKPSLSQPNSSIPLSARIGRNVRVWRRTKGAVMSIALLTSHELVKNIQSKLIDFQALNDAPDRIEVVPSVFVDKSPIMSTLKADIKAEYSKLGEQLKKL